MKILFFPLLLLCINLMAQPRFDFNKRFVECEDQWVVFDQGEDSSYVFGFIYIDAQAGLTLNYEGKFRYTTDGKYTVERIDKGNMKYRLQNNNVKIAILPRDLYKELGVTDPPDWLKYYKTDTGSVKRLYRWGFLYNGWDQFEKALTYLERAYVMDPKFKGLEVELAFSYNALGKYEKAMKMLNSALQTSKDDWYLYKELSYTQMKLGLIEEAEASSRTGIPLASDTAMKAEIAYNMAYTFYSMNKKEKYTSWATEARKWITPGDQFDRALSAIEKKMKE